MFFKKKEVKDENVDGDKRLSVGLLIFKQELKELETLLIPQAKVNFDKKEFGTFDVTYKLDESSYWYPGTYEFSFKIPDEYPNKAPKVHCNTKIYHPNIDLDGNVCLNILKDDWKPTITVSTLIASVYYLFYDPNPKDPLNHEASEVMRDNLDEFIKNVKKTLKGGKHYNNEFKQFVK